MICKICSKTSDYCQECKEEKRFENENQGSKTVTYPKSYSLTSVMNRIGTFMFSYFLFYILLIIGTFGTNNDIPQFWVYGYSILFILAIILQIFTFIRIFLPADVKSNNKSLSKNSIKPVVSIIAILFAFGTLFGLIFSILIILRLDSYLTLIFYLTYITVILLVFLLKKYYGHKNILKTAYILIVIDIILFFVKTILQYLYY